jgi:aminoglycoside phosphotransferase (APT) family kinase protein
MTDDSPTGLSIEGVGAWLAERVGDVGRLEASLVAGGHSCLTYLVTAADHRVFVVRRPPLGETLASAHDVLREHRIITALVDTPVPVAPVVGACDDPAVTGAPFYVMAFVPGVVLHDKVAAETLAPAARRRAGESMVDVLAALHAVDIDAVGLGDLAKRSDYLGRQLKRWHGQWQASALTELDGFRELHDWLVAEQPPEGAAGLVHGDFRLGNAIHAEDGTVAALLDWELSTLGPPEADLSYLVASWVPPGVSSAGELASLADGFPTAGGLVARYQERSGQQIGDLGYWLAFHAWRSACIGAGVYTRYAHGQMGAERGTDLSRLAAGVQAGVSAGLVSAGLR